MQGGVLVVNCGSSSVKFAVIVPDRGDIVVEGVAQRLFSPRSEIRYSGADLAEQSEPLGDCVGHARAMQKIVALIAQLDLQDGLVAVGHRVVHGGEAFSESVIIDRQVVAAVTEHSHLAPLHNPANLLGIAAAQEEFPGLPQVAVFDTAFHQSMPQRAYLYALPYELYREAGVRRYGFHGSSHRYVSAEAAGMLGKSIADCNVISAHLGNGCSVCAVLGGKSVDTSMGMTPLEGLVMGTRCGDLDPSLPAYLERHLDCDPARLEQLLSKESGLLGLSGLGSDCRSLEQAAVAGNTRAQLALDIFCYRLAKYVAGYFVACHPLDAVVLTGGIGENSSYIRGQLLQLLEPLAYRVDPAANERCRFGIAGTISAAGSPAVLVIPTNEEWVIAADAARLAEKHR